MPLSGKLRTIHPPANSKPNSALFDQVVAESLRSNILDRSGISSMVYSGFQRRWFAGSIPGSRPILVGAPVFRL